MEQPQRRRTEACGKGLILPCADTNWIRVRVYLSPSPSAGLRAPLSTAFLATVKANGMISVPISVAGPHLQTGVPSVLLCRTPSPGLFHPDWIYGALGHKGSLLSLAHPLGLLLEVRIRWVGTGLFPLAPMQVSIVQMGGFILCTHLDLSLLGALLWKRKIDYDLLMASLSNIKGCRESDKGDRWEWLPLHRGFQGHSAPAWVAAV